MKRRYSLYKLQTCPPYWGDRRAAISAGRCYARLLGRPVQLMMEYAYNEAPDEWHLGGLSILQPHTLVDTGGGIV